MIPLARLGVVAALIALMFAGWRGDVLLGLLAGVVGCYSGAVLREAIEDCEDRDDD